MFTAILNKGLNTPYEYENILVTNYGSSVIYFENQSPIWKLEIASFQMIYSLSILFKVFTKILLLGR